MNRKPTLLALPPLMVLLMSGCGSTAVASQQKGTVTGTVTAGPTCPVERIDHPCPLRAVPGADVRLVDSKGSTVADTHSDGTEAFLMAAVPGTYTLTATNSGAYRSQTSRTVTLTAGGTQRVDLQLDTGIR